MRILLFIFLLVPTISYSGEIKLNCALGMNQFKADSKMFPLIGDSNQRLLFQMKNDGHGEFTGEAKARFENDQSGDDSNSLHGVRAIATYSKGDGLKIFMNILAFESKDDTSAFTAIATVVGLTSFEKTLKEGARDLEFGYMNPKVTNFHEDLRKLLSKGIVKDYDVFAISFEGCWLE
ncbi:MAG: hypothetical protein HON90_14740 [Halobacteriovoraceae bacterium]|jgi:hypothetical protein|nr:hypothetical protein [Halobacteriovoraceae bacterium]